MEYHLNPVIAFINSTPTSMEVEDVLALLLSQEMRIQTTNNDASLTAHMMSPTAHSTKRYKKMEPNRFENRPDSKRNNDGWRGRGRGSTIVLFRRICFRSGHTAYQCYQRFDKEFKPNSNNNNNTAFYSSLAIIASLEWLLDIGATNHNTNDQRNIENRSKYNGNDKLFVGNGQGLSIANTDSSNFKTSFGNLMLTNILHVPSIKKKKPP